MKILVILLTALGLLAGCGNVVSCPTAEILSPCTCKHFAFGLNVMCADFNENSELLSSLEALHGFQVQNFVFHGLNLTEFLPGGLFNGLEISQVRVEKSKLKFSEPAFTGLEEFLQKLIVTQQSSIKSSKTPSLARLNKLKELDINNHYLGKVTNNWLNGKIPNVHTITLEENEINEIENYAFQYLLHLKSISIAENRIKTVLRSMFPRPAIALTKIDLSANEIQFLPDDLFFDMPNLKELLLSGNDLMTLKESTWKLVWGQLSYVNVRENILVCDEKLHWMTTVKWPYEVVGSCRSPKNLVGKSLKKVYNS